MGVVGGGFGGLLILNGRYASAGCAGLRRYLAGDEIQLGLTEGRTLATILPLTARVPQAVEVLTSIPAGAGIVNFPQRRE